MSVVLNSNVVYCAVGNDGILYPTNPAPNTVPVEIIQYAPVGNDVSTGVIRWGGSIKAFTTYAIGMNKIVGFTVTPQGSNELLVIKSIENILKSI